MKNVLSPTDYRKKLLKKKISISKHNINFEKFKKERGIKLRNFFFIVTGAVFVFGFFLPNTYYLIAYLMLGILILGSPAILQYSRGDLNWTNWIWYCLGMGFIGIGFIFLFFFLPPEDRLEKEFKEFELKKIKI